MTSPASTRVTRVGDTWAAAAVLAVAGLGTVAALRPAAALDEPVAVAVTKTPSAAPPAQQPSPSLPWSASVAPPSPIAAIPPPPPQPPTGLTAPAASLWTRVMAQSDHRQHPFVILDKQAARLFVFDGNGRLRGDSVVLLGHAVGDDSVPGIGQRPIADIRPSERTTPAGRFSAEPGRNHEREDIVWIDYDAAVSMHRLRASAAPAERRPQRLASPSVADNRISYGCVNVPPPFYDAHIRPTLGRGGGVIYVLPETRSLEKQFPALYQAELVTPA